MAKLPRSFREQNKSTRPYRERYKKLPASVQALVREYAIRFHEDPTSKSLRVKELKETHRGRHCPGTFSVSITMKYRALFFWKDGVRYWYWIGTHADYDNYIGSS